jgi:hypothetical protein
MPDLPQIADANALAEKLQDILVTGSLYRSFVYTGSNCHQTDNRGYLAGKRFGELPHQLRMYCGPLLSKLTENRAR